MSLAVLLLATVPWPQWHPSALLMGVGAVEPFACHRHFPASNTLPHLPPLSSSSCYSQAFVKLCGTGDVWKPKALKNCDSETGQRLKNQGDRVSLAIWIPINLEPLQSLLASPRKSDDTETHPTAKNWETCLLAWLGLLREDGYYLGNWTWVETAFCHMMQSLFHFFIFLLRSADLCFNKTS